MHNRFVNIGPGKILIPFISVTLLSVIAGLSLGTGYYWPLMITMAVFGIWAVFLIMNAGREDLIIFLILGFSIVQRGPLNIVANISILEFLVGAVLLWFLFHLLLHKSEFSLGMLPRPVWIALAFMVTSEIIGVILYPGFLNVSYKVLINFIEFIVVLLMTLRYCRKVGDVERILKYAVLVGMIAMLITVWEIYFGVLQTGPHYTVFGNKDITSASTQGLSFGYIALDTRFLLPFSLTLWYAVFKIKPKALGMGIAAMALVILAVSTRRTIYLSVIVSVIALFWLQNRKYAVIISILAVVLGYIYVFSNPLVNDLGDLSLTMQRIASGQWVSGAVSGSTVRFNLYVIAVRLSLTHPFWGYGMGGFAKEIYNNSSVASLAFDSTYLENGTANAALTTHSQYLEVLLDYGAVVLVLFVAAMWLLIRRSYLLSHNNDNRISSLAKVLFVCQAGWAIAAIFESLFHATSLKSIFFYVSAALILSLMRVAKLDRKEAALDVIS
jgi:O-antigen ligase